MQIRDFRQDFISVLTPIYDATEAENFFYMLLEEYQNMKRVDLAMFPDKSFSASELAVFEKALEKLKSQIPIQYIIGKAHFFGLEFEVNPNVLIPRPETEELVDWIIKDFEFKGSPKILDIGTGSGCIPISVAKNLHDSEVFAIDVSPGAIETARRNANKNQVRIHFIEADILTTEDLDELFDVIVSNPPYVRHTEKEEMRKNVLDHEPHLALFVEDDDALLFYRKIADLALKNLKPDGKLYFEINQYLGKETVELLKNKGFSDVELRNDLFGNGRMVKANR
ncbi:peptide chain release factor N(5)-glutamine methyltransferase [Flavobacterium sp. MAH-1]|uniref:Release factor glutamine methyltransferase n=1 Tax=Flavobacterium agri TaxID=2743471 RepID=A0A7Y9C678_9FLAO|nr:peptide chain release factor N(5)-glutamine methyltransferase [Flavobacterium agri]NUY82082.1 peptide chain release factor N(5)-glutamine methyltransferase [Flavobacterium agri]NYA72106.1 peptide chain release factor N(5)-glutamine methyltransferase [Flavobacterium agri]